MKPQIFLLPFGTLLCALCTNCTSTVTSFPSLIASFGYANLSREQPSLGKNRFTGIYSLTFPILVFSLLCWYAFEIHRAEQKLSEHTKEVKAERVHLRMTDCSGVAICKKRLQLSESFLWGNKEILITHTCSLSFVVTQRHTCINELGKTPIVPFSNWINHKLMWHFKPINTAFKYRSEYLQ